MDELIRDRYRIVGPIGEGGMGAVYLAEDRRLPGRRCALKRIRLPAGIAASDRAGLIEAFAAEASLLARLDHPALPKVSDHFEDGQGACLVMDFVGGQDLREILGEAIARRRHIEEASLRRWAEALCGALAYLHAQQPVVIHRDIKPANVKLTPDGQVRLLDFGLARPSISDDGPTLSLLSGAGSRSYQPLEQYGDGRAVDARSDLYALGATLYHLATGTAPPSAQDRFLTGETLASPRSLRPELSEALQRAILRAMALHPDQRPTSAEALLIELQAVGSGGEPGETGTTSRWVPAWRANRWLAVLVIVLFLASLALSL